MAIKKLNDSTRDSISKQIKMANSKPWLLYAFVPIMVITVTISLFGGKYMDMIYKLIGLVLLYISIKTTEIGLKEYKEYSSAAIAKAPKYPWRLIAAVIFALMILLLGITTTDAPLWQSMAVAIIGGSGVVLYYGIDPTKDKVPTNMDVNAEHLLNTLKEAEQKIENIQNIQNKIDDAPLYNAIDGAIKKAQEIIDNIKEDPSDIRVARKFLVVYVAGIEDVVNRYTALEADSIDPMVRDRLIALLKDATLKFEEELKRLKSNDMFHLDVQIDALKEQLKYN